MKTPEQWQAELAGETSLESIADIQKDAQTDLLAACKLAKKYLEPDLVEPGRTVFWKLVEAIDKVEGPALKAQAMSADDV